MLQVQDERKSRPVTAAGRCRLCRHLDPYGKVDGCTKGRVPILKCGKPYCCCYVESPKCFACGIIIRPHGSSSVAVPLDGTKRVTCEDCAETLKVRGFFRYSGSQDGRERRWHPGDGIFREEIADSTHED